MKFSCFRPTYPLAAALSLALCAASAGVARGVSFNPPSDTPPRSTQGGASRGGVTFNPPSDAEPRQTQGGASRGDVTFEPPNDGSPVNTNGAGSRRIGDIALTSLLPESHYGRTLRSHPDIFVYVPDTAADRAFFSVLDEAGNQHYQGYVTLPDSLPGVMRLTLPEDAAALERDRPYQWHVALVGTDNLRPDSPRVSGWIKRVGDDELTADTPTGSLALAERYAAAGIWYDTLSVLADLRAAEGEPENPEVGESWASLLEQVGLNEIARLADRDLDRTDAQ